MRFFLWCFAFGRVIKLIDEFVGLAVIVKDLLTVKVEGFDALHQLELTIGGALVIGRSHRPLYQFIDAVRFENLNGVAVGKG